MAAPNRAALFYQTKDIGQSVSNGFKISISYYIKIK